MSRPGDWGTEWIMKLSSDRDPQRSVEPELHGGVNAQKRQSTTATRLCNTTVPSTDSLSGWKQLFPPSGWDPTKWDPTGSAARWANRPLKDVIIAYYIRTACRPVELFGEISRLFFWISDSYWFPLFNRVWRYRSTRSAGPMKWA